ncbi:NAD(+) synthase [Alkalicaulis satelles]|uniref:Glutamine-dependent NAD(+) synthetase n=1 Tax=Alkalicaulis satelles TaxID=2609175 RepID=A0A5M6ZDM6_9PROT|nr:NAD(+) synthase [Alkalicaulis satelles]KAA5802415.1 NAD(+) synthase [Alkalicaulis satelles]
MAAFDNLYRHRMVRAAAFAPQVSLADPQANAGAILSLAREAHERQAALALFPELALTGYSAEDLHHQSLMLDASEAAAGRIIADSAELMPVIVFGCALRQHGQLFNCALIVHRGRLLGVVPKSYLPNYREFYEKRWFSDASSVIADQISVAGHDAPFGAGLVFEAEDLPGFILHAEVCEDFWAPVPPSTHAALAGASVMVNLSASNATIGKARERAALIDAHSRRTCGAYVFCAAGAGESTNDLAWDGQLLIYEQGMRLAAGERFLNDHARVYADIDIERIEQDRLRLSTFRDAAARAADTLRAFRRVRFTLGAPLDRPVPLEREISRFPFVPDDAGRLDEDCHEAWNIQVQSLAQRLRASGVKRAVIGVSGGLDSTQALIITARAFDRLGRDRADIIAVSMPGLATSGESRARGRALIDGLGATFREIDISPAAERMLADLDHPYARGEPVHDVTFENVQAGLRTDYLFRLANHEDGLVIGTGDLSELALGWCTYGVGDQMSHYNVNAGVAKTLIQHLIAWTARREAFGPEVSAALESILAAEITPELVPAGADGAVQSTEAAIGPYALHDFTLHYAARYGFGPEKIAFLAAAAWSQASRGRWPAHVAGKDRHAFDLDAITRWMTVFARRFYQTSQFKRSAMPNGPKLTSAGALSPRGDWRAPSDASARVWLEAIAALRAELGLPPGG